MNAATQPPPAYTPPQARTRELVTPEGIDLRIVLAEAGERAAALLLDLAIILGVLIAVTIALAIMGGVLNFGVEELIGVVWLLAAFFLRNFYFTAFELTPRAATPGKRALGLRVAMRDGGRLTAEAIFLRNRRAGKKPKPLQLMLSPFEEAARQDSAGVCAAAPLHAVRVAGYQHDAVMRDTEPFRDQLGEARLVSLSLGTSADNDFDHALGLLTRLGGVFGGWHDDPPAGSQGPGG